MALKSSKQICQLNNRILAVYKTWDYNDNIMEAEDVVVMA